MVTPASDSQIAVCSKRDLILVNLVTGFSMSLPALNQRKNTVKLFARLDGVPVCQACFCYIDSILEHVEIEDMAIEFTHVTGVGCNFTDNFHKTVSLCQTKGMG